MVVGDLVAGGQIVNLAHVTTLRSFGFDARLLIVRPTPDPAFEPKFPPGVTPPPWQLGAEGLTDDDVVVVGEMFAAGARAVMDSAARKVIHNQNPHYLFQAFTDIAAIERWGARHMICASRHTAAMSQVAGWTGPKSVVRPFIDPRFAPDVSQRRLAIAAMPRKRQIEWRLIRGLLWSRRPDLARVPWVVVMNADAETCVQALQSAELFLSLSYHEGLGLPPLEAMASGALVIGYHGAGGREYATPANGDWFDDGQHLPIVDTLAERLDQLTAGETFADRRAEGIRTAAAFNRPSFEAELKAAWDAILAN